MDMDNLPKTWDDWISNFKTWQDNVGFKREWMGDFDLSIQFDWERAGDSIEFGDYEGRAKWERSLQVPHQSMRDALVSMITVQGDTEFASVEQQNQNLRPKIFIQINIGNEIQKSGIKIEKLSDFYNYCIELNLDIIGLMCLPPIDQDPNLYFLKMSNLNKTINLNELSMGMSSDYLIAVNNSATYLRIGSSIFGQRS